MGNMIIAGFNGLIPIFEDEENVSTIQELEEHKKMEDLIKREDAIKAVDDLPPIYHGWGDAYDKAYIIQTLEEVPSAKMDGEYIRREDAVKASWKALYDYQDEMETKFRESDDVEFGDWFIHRIFVQGVHGEILNRIVDIPSAEPTVDKDYLISLIQEAVYDGEACKRLLDLVEPEQGEWIPCSERLPKDSGDYLVRPSDSVLEDYSEFGEVMIMPYDADCEAFGWWTDRHDPISLGYLDSDFNEVEVLAWMPLPPAYEGE